MKEVETEVLKEVQFEREGHDKKRICGGQKAETNLCAPTSGTLHMLFPLPGIISLQVAHPLIFFRCLLKNDLLSGAFLVYLT